MIRPHRSVVITSWNFLSDDVLGMTPAEAAYELTQRAVRCQFVAPREAPPGATLKEWGRTGKAPFWACLAAVDLLMEHGWLPDNEVEWSVLAHLWLRAHGPFANIREVSQALPEYLAEGVRYFELAFEDTRLFQARNRESS